MADSAAARREARKRKILENSEKRMNRLTNRLEHTNSVEENSTESYEIQNKETEKWLCKICSHENPMKRDSCFLCSSEKGQTLPVDTYINDKHTVTEEGDIITKGYNITVDQVEITKDNSPTPKHTSELKDSSIGSKKEVQKSSDETLTKHNTQSEGVRLRTSRNTVKIQKPVIDVGNKVGDTGEIRATESGKSQQKTNTVQLGPFEVYRILGCILLAALCRMVLQTGYGLFYFQTIVLPFAAFQAGLYYYRETFLKDTVVPPKGNMMSTALMLCGIKPDVILKYNEIMGYVTSVTEDFALFLFMFLMSGLVFA